VVTTSRASSTQVQLRSQIRQPQLTALVTPFNQLPSSNRADRNDLEKAASPAAGIGTAPKVPLGDSPVRAVNDHRRGSWQLTADRESTELASKLAIDPFENRKLVRLRVGRLRDVPLCDFRWGAELTASNQGGSGAYRRHPGYED